MTMRALAPLPQIAMPRLERSAVRGPSPGKFVWRQITLFNPVVYLVSGFRWSFYGLSDVGVGLSLGVTLCFTLGCCGVIWWIFKTGYRLRS